MSLTPRTNLLTVLEGRLSGLGAVRLCYCSKETTPVNSPDTIFYNFFKSRDFQLVAMNAMAVDNMARHDIVDTTSSTHLLLTPFGTR